MHRLALGALAGIVSLGVLAGCLREKVTFCKNGAYCPEPLACTENAVEPFCGTGQEVGVCFQKPDETPCETTEIAKGYCVQSICTSCDPNIGACVYDHWVTMQTPVTEDLYALWVGGPRDVYAVGRSGVFIHWNGQGWEKLLGPVGGDLRTLAAASANDMFASVATSVYHFDGTVWSAADTSAPQALIALWSAGPNDFFSAGFRSTSGRFLGTWSYVAPFGENTLGLGNNSLTSIWGLAPDNVFVAGSGGAVIHWNGSSWASRSTGTTYSLKAIGGSSATDIYATGFTGLSTPVLVHYTGSWTDITSSLPTDVTKTLLGIYAADASNVFVVGEGGAIIRGQGTTWTSMQITPASSVIVNAVDGADREVFAVGNGGAVFRYHIP